MARNTRYTWYIIRERGRNGMESFKKQVYETVRGNMDGIAAIPGVHNLFARGQVCDVLYEEIYDANLRLRKRLSSIEEDPDVEIIMNNLLDICRLVGEEMYRCGAMFGSAEAYATKVQKVIPRNVERFSFHGCEHFSKCPYSAHYLGDDSQAPF